MNFKGLTMVTCRLLLAVLLAVLGESRRVKAPLKLNGSSTLGFYQRLKIHSKFLPKDTENNVPLRLKRTVETPVYSQEGSVIPGNAATVGSINGIGNVNENDELNRKREFPFSGTPKNIYGSNELVKNSLSVTGQESLSLIDSVLGYLNFGNQHNDDLNIDPEFEHLPEVNHPEIDPEFEHLPSTKSGSSVEDWVYDFPTREYGVEIASNSINDLNFQRSQMLNENKNVADAGNAPDEEYYFDSFVDESVLVPTKINPNDMVEHPNISLQVTMGDNERHSFRTDSTSQFSNTETIHPRNIDVETSSDLNEYFEEYDYFVGNDLVYHSLKNSFFDNIDYKFRSLVFNPVASPHEKFQECKTPRNETGHCRYVQHCFLPNIIASLGNFMKYVCIIEERFIGICCPEFPVHTVEVNWKLPASEIKVNSTENVTQPEGGCGISSKTRIIGGSKADPKEWPWMAALLSKTRGNFFCGGALINSKYVLTAAHCTFRVPQNQILIRLGEYDFSDSSDGPGEDFPVVEIKRHALYSRKTLRNDIALLKLGRPAKFDQFVATICLPEGNNTQYIGQMATLAGWGNTKGGGPTSKVLLEASFPVWSNSECTRVQGLPIRKVFMCAGAREKDKGACNGDSGGPLMLLDERTKLWKAIGIVSWGRRGCDTRYPTVFTRVSSYLSWIKAHSAD